MADNTTATFQYGQHGVVNNAEKFGTTSQTKFIFAKVFRKFAIRKKHGGEISENNVKLTSYGNNENSESEGDEDFQDGILLMHRVQRI